MYNELNIEYFYPTVAELPVTAFLILFIFYHVNLQIMENNNLQVAVHHL